MLPFFHFQPHGNRFQFRHAFGQPVGCDSQLQGCRCGHNAVLHRGRIYEWNGVTALKLALECIVDFRRQALRMRLYIHRGIGILARPCQQFALESRLRDAPGGQLVVHAIHDDTGFVEQSQFLPALFFHRGKVFLMRVAQVCQHADCRLDDFLQCQHLTRAADSRLEEAHLRVFLQKPDAQGYAYLRIVAPWAPDNDLVRGNQLIEPFLHNGLSVAARDTYNRDVILITMTFGQALQGLAGADHFQEIGLRVIHFIRKRNLFYDKVPHSAPIKVGYIIMSVIAFRLQCEKQSLFRETQRAAVRQQKGYVGVSMSKTTRTDERGNLFNSICHRSIPLIS